MSQHSSAGMTPEGMEGVPRRCSRRLVSRAPEEQTVGGTWCARARARTLTLARLVASVLGTVHEDRGLHPFIIREAGKDTTFT